MSTVSSNENSNVEGNSEQVGESERNEEILEGQETQSQENLTRWQRTARFLRSFHAQISIFLIFFLIFNIACFVMYDESHFVATRAATELFVETGNEGIDFRDIGNSDNFISYVEGPMLNAFLLDLWHESMNVEDDESRHVLRQYRLLGAPRMRQVKVRNDSCIVREAFRKYVPTCFNYYSSFSEQNTPYGPAERPDWVYSTARELNGRSFSGFLSRYGGGGYYRDLPLEINNTGNTTQRLRASKWITEGTRAVFVDIKMFNANVSLFYTVKLLVEFPPFYHAIPSWYITTFRFVKYTTSFEIFVLACEVTVVVFNLFYTIEAVRKLNLLRLGYFGSFWNIVDFAIVILIFVWATLNTIFYFNILSALDRLQNNSESFTNFDHLVVLHKWVIQLKALALFLAWIKLLKFTKFKKILSRSYVTCVSFLLLFFTFVLVYTTFAFILFSSSLEAYNSFFGAFISLMKICVLDFDYESLRKLHPVLGPIFFFMYVLFTFSVLLNMFLAIIYDEFSVEELQKSNTRLGYDIDLWQLNKGNVDEHAGKKVYDVLLKNNFSKNDVELFFSKYNINLYEMESMDELALRFRATAPRSQPEFLDSVELETLMQQVESRIENVEMLLENTSILADRAIERLNQTN
ncbi:hypothetical protein PR048_028818 [Dryococelus australis]|uniref:Polycystic kidney disease 2-like 1 protein n=1 Tax=Dryococelus australis TaxID=614101 RepID=A0ABQ9GBM3_9NEOP|nr:hypothetical protein PR048_028818 [Dryococelus australis]